MAPMNRKMAESSMMVEVVGTTRGTVNPKPKPHWIRRRRHLLSSSFFVLALPLTILGLPKVVGAFSNHVRLARTFPHKLEANVLTLFERLPEKDSSTLATSPNDLQFRRRKAPNRKTQLRWIAQRLEKMNYESESAVPYDLIELVYALANAQSQDQVIRIGRDLSTVVDGLQLSPAVKERLIKVTAMTGLFQMAISMTKELLLENILPSEITQDSLISGLRRGGRSNQIEEIMQEMGKVAQNTSAPISLSAFNIMLAALCDDCNSAKYSTYSNRTYDDRIDDAWKWISEQKARKYLCVTPNAVSYATILQAAARKNNRSLADEVWASMQDHGINPNPFAYNAMLKLAGKGQVSRDEEVMQLWTRMQFDPRTQPDRYTINMVLPVLIRRGETHQAMKILDDFVVKNSSFVVTDAFAAFMITLNNTGQTKMARELFRKYIKPYFDPLVTGDAGRIRLVVPTVKHFNVILQGYRQELELIERAESTNEKEQIRTSAWELYNGLIENRIVEPDEFTFSTMMGLASSSADVCEIARAAIETFKTLPSVLQRASVTAFGNVGDASSACWFFAVQVLPSSGIKLREWNVLFGALARASQLHNHNTTTVDTMQSTATLYFPMKDMDASQRYFLNIVDGLSPGEAASKLLDELVKGCKSMRVFKPDSQSFCLVATALQYNDANSNGALSLFRQAQTIGVLADGRFVNAIMRCFGDDIGGAIDVWKQVIRPACLSYENRDRSEISSSLSRRRSKGKNLIAAYNGLMYCTGRALRPDIGLRLVYAMVKEGLEPNETTLNSYRAGKRLRQSLVKENRAKALARKLALLDPYESLLLVECTKYDQNDRRRKGERRVRIIV